MSKLFDLEAEYSVLGSMIVQPSYIFRGVELLQPEDFFREENRALFTFIRDLVAEGYTEAQLNEISFKDELVKKNLLEKVGGEEHLAYVVEFALDTYEKFESACKVVKDKALLRRILEVANFITEKVEETPDPDLLIDSIEKKVFSLSEERITNTLVPVGDIVPEIVKKVEELAARREMVTGIPTGFTELDRMTSGLHDSDLIILAARPSMGKTALALSIAYNVAVKEGKNVAFFSLEMSKEQIAMRLIAQDSKIPLYKIRSGFLFPQEVDKFVESADRIAGAPLFIDDTPGITIVEMRAKARRLQSERGLDLIIVDYLQLMRGIRRTESRQQEVSEISRSLKALAKELNVPVIALSQLSRQVEHRADKRPQLSDLRESGCLTGDTLVIDADTGKRIPIKELVGKTFNTLALDHDFKIRKFRVSKVFPSGKKKVFLIKTRSGREIKASANHPFLKLSGWVKLDELKVGDRIAVPRRVEESSDIFWDEVVEIKELGVEEVYDMTVPEVHNFVANDFIVHNSIEQDADVVMFIHRPEVYKKNPDPEEEGIAEIIIAKQRNGPTGTIKLAFIKEFTRFENLDDSGVQKVVKEELPQEPLQEEPESPVIDETSEEFNFDDEDYGFDF
jgi:replicative DNA helicase